jgi:HPt (histidine-containing phosphotransfer) domain-containing protein
LHNSSLGQDVRTQGIEADKKETMDNKEPIDYPSALQRIGNDESFLKELIDLYIMTFESRRAELFRALAEKNFDEIRTIGHTLKGSSANLSLLPLQEVSFQLETAGKEADIVKAAGTLELLEIEFERLKAFVAAKA